jgi:hypothetical protein
MKRDPRRGLPNAEERRKTTEPLGRKPQKPDQASTERKSIKRAVELRVKVRHLAGGDTLRHASVQALVVRSG